MDTAPSKGNFNYLTIHPMNGFSVGPSMKREARENPDGMALISEANIDVNVNRGQGLAMTFFARPCIW
jgi:hypothetical protein